MIFVLFLAFLLFPRAVAFPRQMAPSDAEVDALSLGVLLLGLETVARPELGRAPVPLARLGVGRKAMVPGSVGQVVGPVLAAAVVRRPEWTTRHPLHYHLSKATAGRRVVLLSRPQLLPSTTGFRVVCRLSPCAI